MAGSVARRSLHLPVLFQRALHRSVEHDLLNLAQSCAYSAIVTLFPAMIVAAALIGLTPAAAPVRYQMDGFFSRILPAEVSPLLESYFVASPKNSHSARVLVVALMVSVSGASSVMATLMEGVRRANGLPRECWSFWERRRRAYALVPLSLVPMALASGLVVFGHFLTLWGAQYLAPVLQGPFYTVALILRWSISLAGSVAVIAQVYRIGSPLRPSLHRTLPGATAATLMWFLTTLAFGWYVTRFANYSQVYGSLGAAIALLFWLYLVSFSILTGAEFNSLYAERYLGQSLEEGSGGSAAHIPSRG